MSHYLFDNTAPQAAQRFQSLEHLHDSATVQHLERLGVSEGWTCWEVGGGSGSIAEWLARRVGSQGHVLVTDIDPRYLAALESQGLDNVSIERHDVGRDPFPAEPFDLIHARLVFVHVPTADHALHQLALALKPGGYLLIEDYDLRFIDRTFPTGDPKDATLFRRTYEALWQLLELHGSQRDWGRSLYQRLQGEGLVEVGMEGRLAVWTGGSDRARLDRANLEQVRPEAVERGLLTEQEVDAALARLDDPSFAVSSPVMFSAWGQRPIG